MQSNPPLNNEHQTVLITGLGEGISFPSATENWELLEETKEIQFLQASPKFCSSWT